MNILLFEGLDNEVKNIYDKLDNINILSNDLFEINYKLPEIFLDSNLKDTVRINICVVFRSKGIFKDSRFNDDIISVYDSIKVFVENDNMINFSVITNNLNHKFLTFNNRKINVFFYKLSFFNYLKNIFVESGEINIKEIILLGNKLK